MSDQTPLNCLISDPRMAPAYLDGYSTFYVNSDNKRMGKRMLTYRALRKTFLQNPVYPVR